MYKSQRKEDIEPIYKKLAAWFLYCWYSGLIIFHISFYSYNTSAVTQTGLMDGLWTSGFAGFTILVIVHHAIIFIETRNYSVPLVIMYLFSVLCYFPLTCLLMEYTPGSMYLTIFQNALQTPTFWLVIICGSALILAPYYAVRRYDEIVVRPEIYTDQKSHTPVCQCKSRRPRFGTGDG